MLQKSIPLSEGNLPWWTELCGCHIKQRWFWRSFKYVFSCE